MIGIYKITSPNDRVYIGQSIDIENRFVYYKRLSCKGQVKLYNSFLKYGVNNHIFQIIEECLVNELNNKERYYQDLFSVISKNGLNIRLTKSNDRSGMFSEETKKIMSISSKKYKPTLETIEKIKLSKKGIKLSEIHKKNLSKNKIGSLNPMFGKNKDEHHNFGKKWKQKNSRNTKKVIDENNGIIYESAKIASQQLNIPKSTLIKYILGYNQKIKNFKYYE